MISLPSALRQWKIIMSALVFMLTIDDVQSQSWLAGSPFARNFKPNEYKAGLQNFNIKQVRRGVVYLANNFGLLEYDGAHWRTYGVKKGTKVRSLAIDGRGRIYVACQGDFGFFFPNTKGLLEYTSLADSLDSRYRNFDETFSVFIDNNKVYFSTLWAIFVYDGHSIQVIELSHPIDQSFFINRQLYVNQRDVGITVLEGNNLRPIEGGIHFKDLNVSSIHAIQHGQYVISTFQNGIFLLNNGVARPWNEGNQKFFKEANINCLIRLKNGQFAAGTQNEGLLLLDQNGNIIRQLTRNSGLENRTVLGLYEDDLHHLWVGQNNAVTYLELGSPFSFINEENGLPGIGYSAYLDNDQFYLGTNTGLHLKKKPSRNFILSENSAGQVYNIGRYGSDLLMSHHHGASQVIGSLAKSISTEPGSWLFLPLKHHPDKLLEGTYSGLNLYVLKNNHWQWKKKLKGFTESSRVMAEDKDGNIWVTHGYKGAFRIVFNETLDSILNVFFYGREKGFPADQLINVFTIRNELVFTSESGTYKYNSTTDSFVADGLFSRILGQGTQLWFIQEDALGNIYFIGREHLGVLRKNAADDYVLYEREFNKIRKYLNDDLQSIDILSNNEVLYAAKNGFIHFDPTVPLNRNYTFTTLIRKVNSMDSTLFDGNYIVQDSVSKQQTEQYQPELSYSNNNIKFIFSATSYEGDNDLMYQYFLENFESEWSPWSIEAQKEYTRLRENNYVFHVRAKNVNGEISDEATYRFTIGAPWYRTRWMYASYGLSAISFLVLSYKLSSRKYKRERQVIVQKQRAELNKKNSEIEELSVQTQTEISRLKNEKLEAEINHTNNELATATMHLLNKNEFIASVKTKLSQLAKSNERDELKSELLKITRDIENNISDDKNWEHFQFHFDRVHGNFTTRLKAAFSTLSPQETKLCAYLRMNLSSKEIAQLLNISVRGVEISRYRLRKKLNLDRDKNLQEFILNF